FTYNYTFPVAGKVSFTLKTFRVDKVNVKLYRLPENEFLQLPSDPNKIDPEKLSYKIVSNWDEPVKNFRPYDWKAETIEVKDNLPIGTYCIEVKGLDKIVNRKYFTVTRTGIVVKRSPSSLLVYAIDLVTNETIPGAKVQILEKRNKSESNDAIPSKKELKNNDSSNEEDNENSGEEDFLNESSKNTKSNIGNKELVQKKYKNNLLFLTASNVLIAQNSPPPAKKDSNILFDQITSNYLKSIASGVTNAEGIYHERIENSHPLYISVTLDDGSFAVANTGTPYSYNSENEKYYIYTDRPVYKNNHIVFFKLLAKERKEKFFPVLNKNLKYEVIDSYNENVYYKGKLKLDDDGTANSSFQVPSNIPMGEYKIKVFTDDGKEDLEGEADLLNPSAASSNGYLGSGRFYLEAYRKPEYKVEVTPIKKYYLNGEDVEFKVEGKYFFGGAMAGAQVNYRFYREKLKQNDNKYWWENDYSNENSGYNSSLVKEGNTKLDENGILILKLPAENLPYDRNITLDVTLFDKSNVAVDSSGSVSIGRGEFYIKVKPSLEFFSVSEKKTISIQTLNYISEPVSKDIKIQFFRNIWKPWQRLYGHDGGPVFETKARTDENGIYTLVLNEEISSAGEYDIVIKSVDKLNNQILANKNLLVYDGTNKINALYKNLEISVNKNNLEKEEEITVLLKSKFTGLPVLLTIEGKDIYEKRVIKMDSNIVPVKIPIPSGYAPNFEIVATMHKNRGLFSTKEEIFIPYKDTKLFFDVKPDKEKYHPGEEVNLSINIKNEDSKPIEADFSIGVVDESIYKIREDVTPNIKSFFYTTISNWVSTNISFPITLLAGSGKDGSKDEGLRKDFKDTAFWNAKVRTDRDGNAKLNFKLPENLTTWRITLRGHDITGRVGENKSKILSTKELIARIGKPRFFVEKDEVKILGLINNNSKEGMEKISTNMEVEGEKLSSESDEYFSLPSQGSARDIYKLTIPENKENLELKYSISSGEYKDALLEKVPVNTFGNPHRILASGDTLDNTNVDIPLKNDEYDFTPKELEIILYPNITGRILSSLNYLDSYPYGCVEQTLNKFLPATIINSLWMKKAGKNLIPDEKLNEYAKASYKKIVSSQNYDGTWGFWYGDRGNEYLTGYVLQSLKRIDEIKLLPVSKSVTDRGMSAINRIFTNPQKISYDQKAYLLYTQSLFIKPDPKVFRELIDEKLEKNSYVLLYLVKTLHQMELNPPNSKDMPEIIRWKAKLTKELIASRKKDSFGTYFDNGKNDYWSWQGGKSEITAIVLESLLDMNVKDQIIGELITSIYKRSSGGAWRSTKETSNVLFAFAKYIEKNGIPEDKKGEVEFSTNMSEKFKIPYDTSLTRQFAFRKIIKLKPSEKIPSLNIISEKLKSPGMNFDIILKGGAELKEKVSPDKKEKPFLLTREFYTISRVKDQNKQEFLVPEKFDLKTPLKSGQELMVKIKFTSKEKLENVLLEDYLPSGFEIIKEDLYDSKGKDFGHIEKRNEKIMYHFGTVHSEKIYEIAYLLRAELSGKFKIRSARVECMYDPETGVWSSQENITVED
ncbi:MAG: hypothetical protein KDK36_21450, partial [Leptospiraceae bacterium]|nr:hypothetical protein [Leptospiraceae bacterium]